MSDGTESRIAGDLEAVYREHGDRLWRSLLLSIGDPDVANDAVAEAFAQALARGDAIRDPAAWVWRAAYRIAIGEIQRVRRSSSALPDVGSIEEPEGVLDVLRALDRLTPRQRRAVVLADYAGYSHAEVGGVLGMSPSAVAVTVYRARRRLRPMLEVSDG